MRQWSNHHLPGRRQAIITTNTGILLIRPLGTNFSEILIDILIFTFKKMRLKVSSAKRRPFCLGLNVLKNIWYQLISAASNNEDVLHHRWTERRWQHTQFEISNFYVWCLLFGIQGNMFENENHTNWQLLHWHHKMTPFGIIILHRKLHKGKVITVTSWWARWRLKLPASRLFTLVRIFVLKFIIIN